MSATDQLLPLTTRHLLAFARRYAQERATGIASLVAREVVRVWPQLPRWEQEKHQQELLEHRSRWDQADREAWQQVLDLPLRTDDETPMPVEVRELAASKELKAWPPHIKSTRKFLAKTGAVTPAVEDTLTLVAAFYQEMPQASALFVMKQDRDRTQDELERISLQLLDERKETEKLKRQLAALGGPATARKVKHELAGAADKRANDKISLFEAHNVLLEGALAKVSQALLAPLAHPETKVYNARKIIADALMQSSNRKRRILARKLDEINGLTPPVGELAEMGNNDSSL